MSSKAQTLQENEQLKDDLEEQRRQLEEKQRGSSSNSLESGISQEITHILQTSWIRRCFFAVLGALKADGDSS